MHIYTLSMPEGDNLLSTYEDPNCAGKDSSFSRRPAVSALPPKAGAVSPGKEREEGTEHVSRLRMRLNTFLKADDATRMSHVLPLQQAVQEFARRAQAGGGFPLERVVKAVESLIQQIGKTPGKIGEPAARTLAHSFDFLANLVTHARTLDWNVAEHINVLAVDDEAISRRAIANALTRAGLGCVSVGDSTQALSTLGESQFDLVVIDIGLPGMDGHELCRRIRAMPGYAKVPVFFVTGMTDFQSRVQSLRSGGTDFITKPFVSDELAVKAMVTIFEQRLGLAPKSQNQRQEVGGGVLPARA